MTDLTRFNLYLNVRDFIDYLGDKVNGSLVFSKLQLQLPNYTKETQYVAYAGGEFKIRQKAMVHISVFDILNRIDYLLDNAHRDSKINLELWDTARLVAKQEVVKEYRAYRLEKGIK